MFHAHGHPNVPPNTCIIYNIAKNTSKFDNVDLHMVYFLEWIASLVSHEFFDTFSTILSETREAAFTLVVDYDILFIKVVRLKSLEWWRLKIVGGKTTQKLRLLEAIKLNSWTVQIYFDSQIVYHNWSFSMNTLKCTDRLNKRQICEGQTNSSSSSNL